MTKPKKRPRRPRNETTSKRVASKAGKLLAMCDDGSFIWYPHDDGVTQDVTELVEAVAGSALTQKAKAKAKRKRRKAAR